MCGRYSLKNVPTHLKEYFKIHGHMPPLGPRYNIAPTQLAPVIGMNPETGERSLIEMKWGLVPFWAKEESIGNKMFNARVETITEKPSFKNLINKKRCIVPASGFYEWQKVGKERLPYYFHRKDDEPLALAGLWSSWGSSDDKLLTFTIITSEANEAMGGVHDRMPITLTMDAMDAWLDSTVPAEVALDMIQLIQPQLIEHYRVAKDINKAVINGPELINSL